MNNNSEKIDQYLSGKMTASEKAVFEDQLSNDAELQEELDIQRGIIDASVDAGVKAEFAKAMPARTVFKRPSTWLTLAAACIALFLLYNYRQNIFPVNDIMHKKDILSLQPGYPFVNPPLPAADVPFMEYSINAEKPDTIVYPSGSIICFPANSMLDESGKPVKGLVNIRYREFADPLDFFVSGIPMAYDSAGIKYNFESSGMCEITAAKDNKALFVNKNAKPVINLASHNKSSLHNVYFLDTVNRKWEYAGKGIVTELTKTDHSKQPAATASNNEYEGIPVKPVKPVKAGDNPSFSIEIDPGSFEELYAYDHLKFEVVDLSTYKPSDADEHWSNVQLAHTSVDGIYTVIFTNPKRQVSYTVRPVLEGADYDAAMKIFNDREIAYEKARKARIENEQARADSAVARNKALVEKINKDEEWNNKMNDLVRESNKKMRELRQLKMDELEKSIAISSLAAEAQVALMDMYEKRYPSDQGKTNMIFRSFQVSGFGVWNCDHPQYQNEVPLIATYTDASNNPIRFPSVAVVLKGFNGITQFPIQEIRVIPGKENMIWSILDQRFYYFSYKDFLNSGISATSKSFVFKMRESAKDITSYKDIRELVENL